MFCLLLHLSLSLWVQPIDNNYTQVKLRIIQCNTQVNEIIIVGKEISITNHDIYSKIILTPENIKGFGLNIKFYLYDQANICLIHFYKRSG